MMRSFYRIFAAFCAVVMCSSTLGAGSNRNNSRRSDIFRRLSSMSRSSSGDATTEQQEKTSDSEYYPFTRSAGKISNDNVAGMRVTKESLVTFDKKNNFYAEPLQGAPDFSEFDFFSRYPNLVSVDLHEIDLSQSVMENLRKYLPEGLRGLIINSCNIDNKDYEYLTDIISSGKNIVSLSIIFPGSELAEATKLTAAIADLKRVRALNLTLGTMGADGCENLVQCLESSDQTLEELRLGFIHIDESESYNKLIKTLGKVTKLSKLEYSVFDSNEDQVEIFFESLGNMNKLKSLKFEFGDFSKHDGVKSYHNALKFKEALLKMTKLQILDISDMNLQDAVFQLIAQALSQLSHLQTLDISRNVLDEKTAQLLSQSIKDGNSLIKLIANECSINAQIFSALCSSLGGTPLKYLYFRSNQIRDGARSLPVSQMKSLSVVDFSDNEMTYEDAMGFITQTENHESLRAVGFWDNGPIENMSGSDRSEQNNKLLKWQMDTSSQVYCFGL